MLLTITTRSMMSAFSVKRVSIIYICVLPFITIPGANGSVSAFPLEEQEALLKFRPMVEDDLYRDYMKDDIYLVPWLRRVGLDVVKAEKALRKAHKWRRANLIDNLTNTEETLKVERELPYWIDGYDRDGRPEIWQVAFKVRALGVGAEDTLAVFHKVQTHARLNVECGTDLREFFVLSMSYGTKWNLRKLMLAGKRVQFNFQQNRMYEAASIKARLEFNATAARNVPDWTMICDMFGYNLRQHACLVCVPANVQIATDWDSYFPELTNIYLINTPRIFDAILQILRPLIGERTNKAIHVLGTNRLEWNELLKNIDPDQIRPSFGGTKSN